MINAKIYLLLFISLFFLPLSANAQQSSISNGVNYLQAIQFSEGNWSSNIVAPYYATDEVLTTLNALGQKYTDYTNGVNWITSQSLYNVDRISRSIALLCSTDNISNLLAFQNIDNGWGIGELFSSDTLDTALALEALRAVNYSGQATISNAILYLVTNQNSDGGWGFYAGDDSNVYMTAMVLQVFDELKATYNLTVPISNAAQYLLSHQNSDGGFGSSTSTVYETTLSFLALLGSGQGSALPLQQAIDYITATQSADGSWNEDAYSTALALRALGSYLPNLYINPGEIGISYTSVTVGSIISVSAILHNNGGLGATNNIFIAFINLIRYRKINTEG